MAKTHGHGNANWNREETILALDLYFRCKPGIPDRSDRRVVELSDFLKALPYHCDDRKNVTFRNPAGVSFKIQNLRSFETGHGLKNTSKIDKEVWGEFGRTPDLVRELAEEIRLGTKEFNELDIIASEEEEFAEGRTITALHKKRERDPRVRKKLLARRKESGPLSCDICSCGPRPLSGELGDSMFEAHHIEPLFVREQKVTRMEDMALLCANCHRLVHRLISVKKEWFTIAEAKKKLETSTAPQTSTTPKNTFE